MSHLEIEAVQHYAGRQEYDERHGAVAARPGDANLSLR